VIECEEDKVLRAVLAGMLREASQLNPVSWRTGSRRTASQRSDQEQA
jgi:hypothetical protein